MEQKTIGIIIILILLILSFWIFLGPEKFQVPQDPTTEYVPQNMSLSEFRKINKWDYPGYMNFERFSNIYPGGREDVDCVDADYMGAAGQCSPVGPYIQDLPLKLPKYKEGFRGGGGYPGGREDIDCITNPMLAQCQYPGSFYYY